MTPFWCNYQLQKPFPLEVEIGSIVVLRSIDFKIAMKKWLQLYGKRQGLMQTNICRRRKKTEIVKICLFASVN
jgi:hypothetical protein